LGRGRKVLLRSLKDANDSNKLSGEGKAGRVYCVRKLKRQRNIFKVRSEPDVPHPVKEKR